MALAPNLAEIRKKYLQKCYIFIKMLSITRTVVLVRDMHSICHALSLVSDKVS